MKVEKENLNMTHELFKKIINNGNLEEMERFGINVNIKFGKPFKLLIDAED